ncbi:methanethiol oxidase isoform X1 [Hydra vulgaris]|uniref:methanethiol oxidase isoform X1 n=1 Tax=Hydra vulgaris TaxID=6087 RepID=UPI001F5FBC9C|nr:methanethiol oxidase [Hydra vulgaris]
MDCNCGPGYPSPLLAMKGEKEKLIYFPCIQVEKGKPNYLATADVNVESDTYSKIIHRTFLPDSEDELHHSGWNSCSSCYNNPNYKRNLLILPSVNSGRVYAFDVATNPRAPILKHVIQNDEMLKKAKLCYLHTTHCLADGNIMISGMGDKDGNPQGSFALIDGKSLKVVGNWEKVGDQVPFGYDFWYQPRHNVMVSSEWGSPNCFMAGFNPAHVAEGKYGHSLHFWKWKEHEYIKSIDLGGDGQIPLELRFMHNPDSSEGYVGCALSSNIFRIFLNDKNEWDAEKVIDVPSVKVEGWALPEVPSLITDILISLDDKYLYFSNWLQGDIRQYDITDSKNPKLVGQVFINGSLAKDSFVKVLDENFKQPEPIFINNKRVEGGPQMIQLSLDGKRLYVSTSLISVWDKQFYPNMMLSGSFVLQVDVEVLNGGLKLNENFFIDCGLEPDGPVLAHEIRYPGGDCSSDIWL